RGGAHGGTAIVYGDVVVDVAARRRGRSTGLGDGKIGLLGGALGGEAGKVIAGAELTRSRRILAVDRDRIEAGLGGQVVDGLGRREGRRAGERPRAGRVVRRRALGREVGDPEELSARREEEEETRVDGRVVAAWIGIDAHADLLTRAGAEPVEVGVEGVVARLAGARVGALAVVRADDVRMTRAERIAGVHVAVEVVADREGGVVVRTR